MHTHTGTCTHKHTWKHSWKNQYFTLGDRHSIMGVGVKRRIIKPTSDLQEALWTPVWCRQSQRRWWVCWSRAVHLTLTTSCGCWRRRSLSWSFRAVGWPPTSFPLPTRRWSKGDLVSRLTVMTAYMYQWLHYSIHVSVIALYFFQSDVTSVGWQKWFMKTGQKINVTGQMHSCR